MYPESVMWSHVDMNIRCRQNCEHFDPRGMKGRTATLALLNTRLEGSANVVSHQLKVDFSTLKRDWAVTLGGRRSTIGVSAGLHIDNRRTDTAVLG